MKESVIEDIIAKYPELIEGGLVLTGRQVTVYGRRMDLLFKDAYGRQLIVELKAGPIKDEHIGQIMSYEGSILSHGNPDLRIMLVGTRVPPNIQRSLDHHGIAWKEITVAALQKHLQSVGDEELLSACKDDQPLAAVVDKNRIPSPSAPGASSHFMRYIQHYPKASAALRDFTPIGTPKENELALAELVAKAIDRSVDMSIDIVRCMRQDGGQLALSLEDRGKLQACCNRSGTRGSTLRFNKDTLELLWEQTGSFDKDTKDLQHLKDHLDFYKQLTYRILALNDKVSVRIDPRQYSFSDDLSIGPFFNIAPGKSKVVMAPLRLTPKDLENSGLSFRDITGKTYRLGGLVRVDFFKWDNKDVDDAFDLARKSFEVKEKIGPGAFFQDHKK